LNAVAALTREPEKTIMPRLKTNHKSFIGNKTSKSGPPAMKAFDGEGGMLLNTVNSDGQI
jgi:hypothetical protein